MQRRVMTFGAALGLVLALGPAMAPSASAHNRAHIVLPTGDCIVIGSEKSVSPGPDKTTFLDLVPATSPADEIGTSFAADRGQSAVLKFGCP